MTAIPDEPALDRLTNRIVGRISLIPALRRIRTSRIPRAVRDFLRADLSAEVEIEPYLAHDPQYVASRHRRAREQREVLTLLRGAHTLPDDIPPHLRHHITDSCLIRAHTIRDHASYRKGLSSEARFARQLYRLGRFFEQSEIDDTEETSEQTPPPNRPRRTP